MELPELFQMLIKQTVQLKHEEMKKHDFSDVNFSLLQYILNIGEFDNLTFSDLAEKMNITKPAVTASIQKLIEKGLVTKQQSLEDKRIFYLSLTEKGQEVFKVSKIANSKLEEMIRRKLSRDEVEQLRFLLAKVFT
ncbi:MarR family transcriptional regulator [Paenibacillus illinoisensis]|uniref:MarR family winged helix-turn-helix transcriptional regulator n=1 Tax=Paenibacillus illinoisensis TaxID=59845 RepID=UPI001C8E90D1|nr:MarR family transcriptional regulator [Paenibacillus illinoisensis]MBY0217828.1 MarR family transcriptional regulator [Paenibacillus illinoisensis]